MKSKFEDKLSQFISAVEQLEEGIDKYITDRDAIIRDGVIKRFEFTTELAWKTLREYQIEQRYKVNSPKAVLERAYIDGMIDNEKGWIKVIDDRNSTSHIYDDETAAEVYSRIEGTYLAMFKDLIKTLESKC